MKHIVVIGVCLCITILFWISCKKTNNEIDPHASIVGSWELRQTTGAMNPQPTVYPSGNGNRYTFTSSGNYELYRDNVLEKTGSYQVVIDPTVSENVCLVIPEGQYSRRIIFDNYDEPQTFFHIIGKELHFISGCYALDGGHTAEYKKQ